MSMRLSRQRLGLFGGHCRGTCMPIGAQIGKYPSPERMNRCLGGGALNGRAHGPLKGNCYGWTLEAWLRDTWCKGVWVRAMHLDSSSNTTNEDLPHVPVLLDAVTEGFSDVALGVFVDGTLGAAGHSSRLATEHAELQCLIGFDKDPVAHDIARKKMAALGFDVQPLLQGVAEPEVNTLKNGNKMMVPVHASFSEMKKIICNLDNNGLLPNEDGKVDGILLDLGVSSMQLDTEERGFSFIKDGPLDMRMDPTSPLNAEVLVNTWSEGKIGKVLKEYGEERYWKSIARKIVERRMESPICTTQQLVNAIGCPKSYARKGSKERKQKHPATRVFQALRIAVNGELESVAQVLPDAIDLLAPGGRLAIITFHSLEDRIVKWGFRQAAGMAPSDNSLPEYCSSFNELQDPRVRILTRREVSAVQALLASARKSLQNPTCPTSHALMSWLIYEPSLYTVLVYTCRLKFLIEQQQRCCPAIATAAAVNDLKLNSSPLNSLSFRNVLWRQSLYNELYQHYFCKVFLFTSQT